jgi:hypothetical protein
MFQAGCLDLSPERALLNPISWRPAKIAVRRLGVGNWRGFLVQTVLDSRRSPLHTASPDSCSCGELRDHMRRYALSVAAAILATGLTSIPAAAAPKPVGGCGQGFELMTVKEVLRTIAASGSEAAIKAEDSNQDGYLCVKIIPNNGGPPQFDPAFAYVDNNAPL